MTWNEDNPRVFRDDNGDLFEPIPAASVESHSAESKTVRIRTGLGNTFGKKYKLSPWEDYATFQDFGNISPELQEAGKQLAAAAGQYVQNKLAQDGAGKLQGKLHKSLAKKPKDVLPDVQPWEEYDPIPKTSGKAPSSVGLEKEWPEPKTFQPAHPHDDCYCDECMPPAPKAKPKVEPKKPFGPYSPHPDLF